MNLFLLSEILVEMEGPRGLAGLARELADLDPAGLPGAGDRRGFGFADHGALDRPPDPEVKTYLVRTGKS